MESAELERGLQAWREAVMADPRARWDAAHDLPYWAQVAGRYEAARAPLPRTVDALRSRLEPHWSLLDVGAGTGRFTRPLADAVRHVTALDYSPAMLQVLRQHLPPNVTPRLGRFQDPNLPGHDAVLCAWALYRSPDLRADVAALWRLARQTLFVLEDNGTSAPHLAWRRGTARLPWPRTRLIAGVLREWTPDVEVLDIGETRVQEFANEAEFLAFARVDAVQGPAFLAAMAPHVTRTGVGLRYEYSSVVTLVTARRPSRPTTRTA